jgi:hypothetical protein
MALAPTSAAPAALASDWARGALNAMLLDYA